MAVRYISHVGDCDREWMARDLDGGESKRAMASIKSELSGRQEIFRQGTLNIFPVRVQREYPPMRRGLLFHNGAYVTVLLPKWVAVEYAGMIRDYHFEEAWEEEYQREQQGHTDEIIEKYLGSEYCIEADNLKAFAPYTDLDIIMEDDRELFDVTRFMPGEFIKMTPPYIGLSARLLDKDKEYRFIIDADGTVLIEIQYRFFRLEKKEEMLGGDC